MSTTLYSTSSSTAVWLNKLTKPQWLWPLLIGLNLLLHAPFFTLPPTSIHVWRQSNTMTVARNFYEEDMNIFRPRVDRRGTSDGVTGMQFPSFEWIAAASYKVFGFHEAIPRVLNWLIFLLGVVAFYKLVHFLTRSAWQAALGAWMFSWSPELFYHSLNALPDVLALSASIWGLYYFLRWYQAPQYRYFLISLVATTLGGLTKLQYLVIGVPIAVLVLRDWQKGTFDWRRRLGPMVLYAAVSVGSTLLWYAYALHLIEVSGLTDFGLEVRSATSWATALDILKDNLVSDIPELILNFATFGFLLLGLWTIGREQRWRQAWFLPLFGWAAALAVYHLLELRQMDVHHYYMLPYLPVLVLVATVGAQWLRSWPNRVAPIVLIVLLATQPVLAFVRIAPARWLRESNGLPPELYYATSRAQLRNAVPDSALCLVGPDESGAIHFYFLHKKGFGFSQTDDLLRNTAKGQPYIAACIEKGARYLYTNDTTKNARLQPYLDQKIEQQGNFTVWKLRSR